MLYLNKVYFSRKTDIFFNIAFEDYLFRTIQPDEYVLYLWHNSSVVVIGRSQNAWKECHVDLLKEDGVLLARRETGGGAVFQDEHNICFTFLCGNHIFDKEKHLQFICSVLKSFGIEAYPTGRNDIEVNGFKVSGSAFRYGKEVSLHHGTLLVATDLSRLTKYLTPPLKKMRAKGIESVRSRVENISSFCAGLHIEKLAHSLIDAFSQQYNATVFPCDSEIAYCDSTLHDEYKKLQSWQWCYGLTPPFTHTIEDRFSFGNAEILLDVQGGMIKKAHVYSDCLDIMLPSRLETLLTDMIYDECAVREYIRTFSL